MRIILISLFLFSYVHAMQCEFDAIEVIEAVADNQPIPSAVVNDVVDEAQTFRRAADEFPDYLIGGVQREHNVYGRVHQQVVSGDISTDQFTRFQEALKRQVGDDGYLRVISPNEVTSITSEGGIRLGTRQGDVYFNNPRAGGAHMGHNRNIVVVKCPRPQCDRYFASQSSPSGSGLIADESIPIEELEFIVPDVAAAARSVGISID